MALFAQQSNKLFSFLLHPELCLQASTGHQWREAEFWLQEQAFKQPENSDESLGFTIISVSLEKSFTSKDLRFLLFKYDDYKTILVL